MIHNISNGTQLSDIINGTNGASGLSPGDVIALGTGLFVPTDDLYPPDNRLDGVFITGSGMSRTTIAGKRISIVSTNLGINDLTINLDNIGIVTRFPYGSCNLIDGSFKLNRVAIVGNSNNNGNLLTFVSSGNHNVSYMEDCAVSGANRDCVSTKAPISTYIADSHLLILNTSISMQGVNGNDQCLTTHDGFMARMVVGSLNSRLSTQNAAASDGTQLILYGTRILNGLLHSSVSGTYHYITPISLF